MQRIKAELNARCRHLQVFIRKRKIARGYMFKATICELELFRDNLGFPRALRRGNIINVGQKPQSRS